MMKFMKKTIKSLLLLGMGAQIIMGLAWIGWNFLSGCSAQETLIYEQAAATLIPDEYVGVLYPLFVRSIRILTGWLGIAYQPFLYVLQLGVGLLSCCGFLCLCERDRKKWYQQPGIWFGGLYLFTIPLCVQWHLTVSPRSLTFSLYLLLLGLCIRVFRKDVCMAHWYLISVLWAALVLLMPDYWWFGLFAIIPPAIYDMRKKAPRTIVKGMAALVIAAVLSVGMNIAVQEPGSGGRIQKTLGACLVSRFVWPNFETNYFFWPKEVKQVMDEMEARAISTYADQVQYRFGPLIEGTYGKKQANQYYWDMALQCFRIRTKEVLKAVSEDFRAYLFTPWSVKRQLDGYGLSYSGWNYGNMKANTPLFTHVYVDYSLLSFRFGLCLSVIGGMLQLLRNPGKDTKRRMTAWMLPVGCVFFQCIWYTMSAAGMMDYGNVPVLILLWYLPIVYTATQKEEVSIKNE